MKVLLKFILVFCIYSITNGQAPNLNSLTPVDDATEINKASDFVLTFDTDVKFNSTFAIKNIHIYENGNPTPVKTYQMGFGFLLGSSEITIVSNVVTINPTDDLNNATDYYILVEDGAIESTGGTPFAGLTIATDWNFTTIVPSSPPTLSSLNPADDATDIAVSSNFVLTFSTNVRFNTTGTSRYIYIYEDGNPTPIKSFEFLIGSLQNSSEVTYSTNTVTINPSEDLSEGTDYYIIVEDGAIENTDGIPYSGLINNTDWNFTTINNPPVTTFNPTNGAIEVYINTTIEISYNRAVRNLDASEITDANVSSLITLEYETNPIAYTATINAEKTLITITPSASLPGGKAIDVTVSAVENTLGGEQSGDQSCTFNTDIFYTWTGASSSSFTDPANWGGTYNNGFSVIIPNTSTPPVISTTSNSANNVIIEAGASLEITSGGSFTISNSLKLKSSADPAIGNANLLVDGTLNSSGAEVITEQYVNRIRFFISSPVSGATMDNSGITDKLFRRDADQNKWTQLSSSDGLTPAVGYFAYSNIGETLEFTGSPNNSNNYTVNTVRTTTPNNFGWNLVGNPYPCSIDWDGLVRNNMDGIFYIKNNENGTFGTYNSIGGSYINVNETNPSHIPSCHAFWTKVTIGETNGSITIPKSARVNTHYTYLKSAQNTSIQRLKFAGINENNLKDELAISFTENALDEADPYDAEKLFSSNESILQLYSIHSNKDFGIDTYQAINEGKVIQLGIKTETSGNYKIALTKLSNMDESTSIQLNDTYLGTTIELALNEEYSFSTDAGTFNDRFLIHISPSISTDVNVDQINNNIQIYGVQQKVYINVPHLSNPEYIIYNSIGKTIQKGKLTPSSLNIIDAENSGINIIKVLGKENSYTQKIYIKK